MLLASHYFRHVHILVSIPHWGVLPHENSVDCGGQLGIDVITIPLCPCDPKLKSSDE